MTDATQVRVDSVGPDGVTARVAVHQLHRQPSAPPLLVSHATGFHARAYLRMAAELGGRFDAWGLDHRGHGATPVPDGWRVDWRGHGADTVAVARWLADRAGCPVTGFGHSMGAATLLMAAAAEPGMFAGLVLFEPIAFPPRVLPDDPEDFPLVRGARRRRARFESTEAAIANYAAKPPLAWFDPAVLADYVHFGFRAADPPPGVELCCTPDHEGDTFAASGSNGVWELLARIEVPVTVVASGDGDGPAMIAPAVAAQIPGATLVTVAEQTHFGPFSHPAAVARLVADQAATWASPAA